MVDQRGPSVNRRSQSAAASSKVLPMIIEEIHNISSPDSGFEDNVIAEDIVSRLELDVDRSVEHQKICKIANRRLVKALGRISIACTFVR